MLCCICILVIKVNCNGDADLLPRSQRGLGWFDRCAESRLRWSLPPVVFLRRYLQLSGDTDGKCLLFECCLRARSAHRLFGSCSRCRLQVFAILPQRRCLSCCQLISCMSVHEAACSARTTSTLASAKSSKRARVAKCLPLRRSVYGVCESANTLCAARERGKRAGHCVCRNQKQLCNGNGIQ